MNTRERIEKAAVERCWTFAYNPHYAGPVINLTSSHKIITVYLDSLGRVRSAYSRYPGTFGADPILGGCQAIIDEITVQ